MAKKKQTFPPRTERFTCAHSASKPGPGHDERCPYYLAVAPTGPYREPESL